MINEKRLDEIEADTRRNGLGRRLDPETIRELAQLARLGLWAEKHGIPALKRLDKTDENCSHYAEATTAINALPKGEK